MMTEKFGVWANALLEIYYKLNVKAKEGFLQTHKSPSAIRNMLCIVVCFFFFSFLKDLCCYIYILNLPEFECFYFTKARILSEFPIGVIRNPCFSLIGFSNFSAKLKKLLVKINSKIFLKRIKTYFNLIYLLSKPSEK